MSWFNILKADLYDASNYSSRKDDPSFYWERPKLLFEQNPDRNLGYIMSYWYLQYKDEIDDWINSTDLEGTFIDTGDRSKTYKHSVGGFFIFRRNELQNEIDNNKGLLEKYNIPTTVEGFVEAVATTAYHNTDIYNFIARQFGDKYKRKDNPLKVHRVMDNLRARQRGFE